MGKVKRFEGKTPPPEFKGFIGYVLSEDEREAIKRTEFTYTMLDEMCANVFKQGYKIFWSFDFKNECFQCAMTCNDPTKDNAGWFLTGRGSTPVKAAKQLFYMHFTLFGSVWPKGNSSQNVIDD